MSSNPIGRKMSTEIVCYSFSFDKVLSLVANCIFIYLLCFFRASPTPSWTVEAATHRKLCTQSVGRYQCPTMTHTSRPQIPRAVMRIASRSPDHFLDNSDLVRFPFISTNMINISMVCTSLILQILTQLKRTCNDLFTHDSTFVYLIQVYLLSGWMFCNQSPAF